MMQPRPPSRGPRNKAVTVVNSLTSTGQHPEAVDWHLTPQQQESIDLFTNGKQIKIWLLIISPI